VVQQLASGPRIGIADARVDGMEHVVTPHADGARWTCRYSLGLQGQAGLHGILTTDDDEPLTTDEGQLLWD